MNGRPILQVANQPRVAAAALPTVVAAVDVDASAAAVAVAFAVERATRAVTETDSRTFDRDYFDCGWRECV